jgi:hypothetical protein
VSSESGSTELFLGDGNDYRASMFPWKNGSRIKVKTLTLDVYARQHRFPKLIKIDVEGAETLVLEGAITLLSNASAPTWVIEVHSPEADVQVNALLSQHRYRCRYLMTAESASKAYPRHLVAEK